MSAWLTAAARHAIRIREGLAAIAEWEAEHGELSEQELAAARARVTRREATKPKARRSKRSA